MRKQKPRNDASNGTSPLGRGGSSPNGVCALTCDPQARRSYRSSSSPSGNRVVLQSHDLGVAGESMKPNPKRVATVVGTTLAFYIGLPSSDYRSGTDLAFYIGATPSQSRGNDQNTTRVQFARKK